MAFERFSSIIYPGSLFCSETEKVAARRARLRDVKFNILNQFQRLGNKCL